MTEKSTSKKIIIVGGGMNGLTLSLLLAQDNFDVTCIDATPVMVDKKDYRTTAISYGSSLILKAAGVWDQLEAYICPIKKIDIMDGNSPSLLTFDLLQKEYKNKFEAFGWIVENKFLYKILKTECKKYKNLDYKTQQNVIAIDYSDNDVNVTLQNKKIIKGCLVIGADGRQSFTRLAANIAVKKWQYNQKAAVFVATHQNPHQNIAVEHFKTHGPFAILPMQDTTEGHHRSAVVWTLDKKQSESILNNSPCLIAAMNARFPERYGTITDVSQPQIYPLNFNHAYQYIAHRTVLIGDAAHGIHPIAGQGLNIGLQDVKTLHCVLKQLKDTDKDYGVLKNLKAYERQRMPDNTAMAAATDLLNRLFSNNFETTKFLRKNGLRIIERIPQSKKFFVGRAMGIKNMSVQNIDIKKKN